MSNKPKYLPMIGFLMLPLFGGCSYDERIEYPGPWIEDFHPGITKALAKNNVRRCSEYKYREALGHSHEFLVYCTNDRVEWTPYLVWDLTGEIGKPDPADLSIPKP